MVSNIPIFRPADTTRGVITALRQGKAWKAGGSAGKLNYVGQTEKFWSIGFMTVSTDGAYIRENFLFYVPLDGVYKRLFLHPNFNLNRSETAMCSYGRFYEDGDVIKDFYMLDTTATNNFLYITKCDTINKRMEGVFNASFRRLTNPAGDPVYPAVLTFTQGKFRAVIRN